MNIYDSCLVNFFSLKDELIVVHRVAHQKKSLVVVCASDLQITVNV